jgi:IS30 family transposase
LILDPRINKLLEEIPEKPPRSKLELHADVISALRRKRLTYREIAQFFQDHLAITVAPSTIHDFVRVRRRRGKRNDVSTGAQSDVKPNRVSTPALKNIPADDEVQQRIAALKQRTPSEAPQPVFAYEEDEPLKLRRNPAPSKSD